MNNPFWLLNNVLVLLLTTASLFVYFTRVSVPEREDIEPLLYSKPKKQQHIAINLKHIYEQDLFGTYSKEVTPTRPAVIINPFPEPPRPQPTVVPEPPRPKFLEPLAITLKGIIVIGNDEIKNSAIISINKTEQEGIYKAGETIEDAQLIRIAPNKIVFLRPNGQQEIVYLNEDDAKADPTFSIVADWDNVVHQETETSYAVDPDAFIQQVKNIAEFIDMFALTTTYQKGVSIGTRIGAIGDTSLPAALGLYPGDVVVSINTIPPTSTENRLLIYNTMIAQTPGETINVQIVRRNRILELAYRLEKFTLAQEQKSSNLAPVKSMIGNEQEAFASTLQKMHDRERQHMLAQGKISKRA